VTKTAGIVTLTDPFVSRHGGTLRTRGFIEGIRAAGFDTSTLVPLAPAGMGAQQSQRGGAVGKLKNGLGVAKRHFVPMPTVWGGRDARLSADVAALDPNFLLVSVLSQAQYATASPAPYWLDFMDVWSDFAAREATHRKPVARLTSNIQAQLLRRYEKSVATQARIVTAAGWTDTQTLRAVGIDCRWVPTAIPDDEFRAIERDPSTAKVAGFIGNFDFWPNKDALATLIKRWLPSLRDNGWTLLVAGHGSDKLEDLPADVIKLGAVGDLDDYYSKIDLTLAPIRLGGGMKVKVVESLARGIPVAGTPFAFDGFPPELAAYFVEVPLDAPDFATLADLAPIDPQSPDLAQFRQSALNATIRDLLIDAGI